MKFKKIKIIHILNSVGGVDVSLRIILQNLDSKIFDQVVIHGMKDTQTPYINDSNNSINSYKIPICREVNFFKDILAIIKAYRIIKKEKPDLIHAHSSKGGIISKLLAFFLKAPVLHTPQAFSFLSAENSLKRAFYLLAEKTLSLSNNKILASSNSERERAIKDVGYSKERVLLFNNSIKPIQVKNKRSIPITWPENYICSVGRPSYQKNIHMMLDVIHETRKTLKDIHLVLMGIGHYSPMLEEIILKIKSYRLEPNITLLEWCPQDEVHQIIKNSKLYLSTARYEGLPYSIIESMSLSKPIVASNADGNKDLVKDGVNGYLVNDDSPKKFSEAIIKILTSPEKALKFASNSYSLFERDHNILKTKLILQNLYKNNITP